MHTRRALPALLALALILPASGCCRPMEVVKVFAGTSTASVEQYRDKALVKVFGYDYGTCYVRAETLLNKSPKVSIYSKNEEMIAVYYTLVNVTPVGIFFTEIDKQHTQVEVSSPSLDAREYIAQILFSGEVPDKPEKLYIEVREPVAGKY